MPSCKNAKYAVGRTCNAADEEGSFVLRDQSFAWGPDLSGSMQGAGGIGGLAVYCDDEADLNSSTAQGPMFPIYDGNGNLTHMYHVHWSGTTPSAQSVADYEFGPFGEVRSITGVQGQRNPFRWSTKYTDAETGLLYYGYRYYSPSMGRWVSRDPLGETANPSLYPFVFNDPLLLTDPFGLWHWEGGKRQGKARAVMYPDTGDTVATAALFAGFDAAQSRLWLRNDFLRTWVNEKDPISACMGYSVPNTVFIDTGDITAVSWIGKHTTGNDWFTIAFRMRSASYARHFRSEGFLVVEHKLATRLDITTGLHDRNIAGWVFVGHGVTGTLDEYSTNPPSNPPPPIFAFQIHPKLHHKLAIVVLHSCEAGQDPEWAQFVSDNGEYYATDGTIGAWSWPPQRR